MTDDKSLLRCIVLKSLHTTERLVVYVTWMIIGSAIVGCIGYLGYIGIPKLLDFVVIVYSVVATILSIIPSWAYIAAGIPTVIVLYSFLWCVSRELTVCDWASDEADNSAVAFAFAVAFAAVAFAAFAVAFADVAFAAVAFAVAFAVTFAVAVAFAVTFAVAVAFAAVAFAAVDDYNGTTLQKLGRFVGAYLHYRRRIKSEKSE